jgi:hypothetical protein
MFYQLCDTLDKILNAIFGFILSVVWNNRKGKSISVIKLTEKTRKLSCETLVTQRLKYTSKSDTSKLWGVIHSRRNEWFHVL